MPDIATGDLIAISPHSALYPSSYSTLAAPSSGPDFTTALVIGSHDFYLNVILPSGKSAWIHRGSCRLARKADRT